MQGQDAVSPVVGTLLILVVFAVVTATVTLVVRPNVLEYQETGKVESTITQLNEVAVASKQLAVSGNEGEVKQAAVSLAGGSLRLVEGHVVATTIEYYGYNYSAVDTVSLTDHRRFHIVGDGAQQPLTFATADLTLRYRSALIPGPLDYDYETARYVDGLWVASHGGSGSVNPDASFDVDLVPTPGNPAHTVRDGPWRIRIYDDDVTPRAIIAEVYLAMQTGFEYRFDGHSGSHRAVSENGALFYHHDGQWKERGRSLVQPPATTTGADQLTVRHMELNTTRGDAASGQTRVGALLNLNVSDVFVFEGGAAQVRMQYWGDHAAIWEKHLTLSGFKDDPDVPPEADGVTWADERVVGADTFRDAFPLHYAYSRIDVRLRNV